MRAMPRIAGLCVAWAGFCDAYYAVFCLMIAVGYLGIARGPRHARPDAPRRHAGAGR